MSGGRTCPGVGGSDCPDTQTDASDLIIYLMLCFAVLCYSSAVDTCSNITIVYCIVTDSCRPFQRSAQMQYMYEYELGDAGGCEL